MRLSLVAVAFAALVIVAGGATKAQTGAAVTLKEEAPEVLPAGEGREDAFYRCTACHSTAVIRRSALSRDRWDELMDWMTEKHAMPPLEGAERAAIVDYLAQAFPPRPARGRRAANPFAGSD